MLLPWAHWLSTPTAPKCRGPACDWWVQRPPGRPPAARWPPRPARLTGSGRAWHWQPQRVRWLLAASLRYCPASGKMAVQGPGPPCAMEWTLHALALVIILLLHALSYTLKASAARLLPKPLLPLPNGSTGNSHLPSLAIMATLLLTLHHYIPAIPSRTLCVALLTHFTLLFMETITTADHPREIRAPTTSTPQGPSRPPATPHQIPSAVIRSITFSPNKPTPGPSHNRSASTPANAAAAWARIHDALSRKGGGTNNINFLCGSGVQTITTSIPTAAREPSGPLMHPAPQLELPLTQPAAALPQRAPPVPQARQEPRRQRKRRGGKRSSHHCPRAETAKEQHGTTVEEQRITATPNPISSTTASQDAPNTSATVKSTSASGESLNSPPSATTTNTTAAGGTATSSPQAETSATSKDAAQPKAKPPNGVPTPSDGKAAKTPHRRSKSACAQLAPTLPSTLRSGRSLFNPSAPNSRI